MTMEDEPKFGINGELRPELPTQIYDSSLFARYPDDVDEDERLEALILRTWNDIVEKRLLATHANMIKDRNGLYARQILNTQEQPFLAIMIVLRDSPKLQMESDIEGLLKLLAERAIPVSRYQPFEEIILEWACVSLDASLKVKYWLRQLLPRQYAAVQEKWATFSKKPRNPREGPYGIDYPSEWSNWRHGDDIDIQNDPLYQDKINWNILMEEMKRKLFMLPDSEGTHFADLLCKMFAFVRRVRFGDALVHNMLRVLLSSDDNGYTTLHRRGAEFHRHLADHKKMNRHLGELMKDKHILLEGGGFTIQLFYMFLELYPYFVFEFGIFTFIQNTKSRTEYIAQCNRWPLLAGKPVRFYCPDCEYPFTSKREQMDHGCEFRPKVLDRPKKIAN